MLIVTDELLLNHLRCRRRSHLQIHGEVTQAIPEKDFIQKLRRENQHHINQIRESHPATEVAIAPGDWSRGQEQTLALMAAGVERIYRGVLWATAATVATWEVPFPADRCPSLLGRPTFLVKCSGQSRFGDWCYVPVQVKLGKRPKAEYKVVSAFHAWLLAQIQAGPVSSPCLILREGKEYCVELTHWQAEMFTTLADCVGTIAAQEPPEVFISRQRCSLCRWLEDCRTVARQERHLSLVPGITPPRYAALKTLGITELATLVQAEIPAGQLPEALPPKVFVQLQQQARSLQDGVAIAWPPPHIPLPIPHGPIELYFDLEAEPERDVDFLFGVLCVNHVMQTEQFYGFLAKTPAEEPLIWQQFLALLDRYPEAPIYHFSIYEADTLKRMAKRYALTHHPIKKILQRCVDLHDYVLKSVTLPIENYSLKTIAQWLGFEWRDALSGDQTVCLYDQWLSTADATCLEAILRYNEDDCRATYVLKTWLEQFWREQASPSTAPLTTSDAIATPCA